MIDLFVIKMWLVARCSNHDKCLSLLKGDSLPFVSDRRLDVNLSSTRPMVTQYLPSCISSRTPSAFKPNKKCLGGLLFGHT